MIDDWKSELLEIVKETGLVDGRPAWALELQTKFSGPDLPYDYYRFLHRVARQLRPALTLEIGTNQGVSAAALATGYPHGLVVTLDVLPAGRENLRDVPNVEALVQDSLSFDFPAYKPGREIDLLFIDGDHTYKSAFTEYLRYREWMKPGAIILMDDILYPEMVRVWNDIKDDKLEIKLPRHHSGFGAVRVLGKQRV